MRLRLGVIGLGRRWRCYRSILSKLRDHVELRAVHDQFVGRTEHEARRLHCVAALGPVELLERSDVDAILLCDAQWFGLWPLEHLCRIGKPVYCALSPSYDAGHADALQEHIATSGLSVFVALRPLLTPAALLLRQLLTNRLGSARLVRIDGSTTPVRSDTPRDLLASPLLLPFLASCAWLLDDRPKSVWTIDGENASFITLILRFGGERLGQLTLWTATQGRTPPRFEVVAESGTAAAELPRQLRWRDADGLHSQRLPPRSAEQNGLERFLLTLRAEKPPWPSFEGSYRALTWLRAAARSRSEGRPIELNDSEPAPNLPLAERRGETYDKAH